MLPSDNWLYEIIFTISCISNDNCLWRHEFVPSRYVPLWNVFQSIDCLLDLRPLCYFMGNLDNGYRHLSEKHRSNPKTQFHTIFFRSVFLLSWDKHTKKFCLQFSVSPFGLDIVSSSTSLRRRRISVPQTPPTVPRLCDRRDSHLVNVIPRKV